MARDLLASSSPAFESVVTSSGSVARAAFQWGGTIFALILLILNRMRRTSSWQTNFLVLFLFTSFPNVFFKILRGEFGCWIAFFLATANLLGPEVFPVSRFALFVVTPDCVADGLREGIIAGVLCLILVNLLLISEIKDTGGLSNRECNSSCFCYCLAVAFLLFFTILYVCMG